MEKALDCPHIAADAALALNKVYSGLHEMEPEGGRYLIRWARILMRPSLLHIEQTCEALEQALMGDTSEAVLPPEDRMRGAPCMRSPLNSSPSSPCLSIYVPFIHRRHAASSQRSGPLLRRALSPSTTGMQSRGSLELKRFAYRGATWNAFFSYCEPFGLLACW